MTLRGPEQAAPYPARFVREAALARAGLATAQRSEAPSETLQMPVGMPTRSPQTSRIWQDSEVRLASHLAHYRFIAAMMGDRHDVAEYGCASPHGTRLILQRSRKITLFDPRPLVVSDLQRRIQDQRFEARLHDINATSLPRQVDSAYCVDFLQYISRDEENKFVRNLCDSLSHDFDFLIIGCPSYGIGDLAGVRQADSADGPRSANAIRPSHQDFPCQSIVENQSLSERLLQNDPMAAGDPRFKSAQTRTYRRTGAELKALMEHVFHNVFMFSVTGDVVQSGILSSAEHVFALSCGKKN
jgi:hypothetical protein